MPETIEARMRTLGIELPAPSLPGASYVPYHLSGNLLFVTGQLCQWNGERRFAGKLGDAYGLEQGQQAARLCGLNLIAQLNVALDGDLDRLAGTVRLAGYVNSTPDFHAQSQVMNGASDLFLEAFGDRGRHTRLAVGVSALPYDLAVEVEGIFEVRPV